METLIKFLDDHRIAFGTYPQSKKEENVTITGERENGKYRGSDGELYEKMKDNYYKIEPIIWEILDNTNGEMFIAAESIIDSFRYSEAVKTYADSEIRKWLNEDFINIAFDEQMQKIILTVSVDNGSPKYRHLSLHMMLLGMRLEKEAYGDYKLPNTDDKIFLLSEKEALKLIKTDEDRKRVATPFAEARERVSYTGTMSRYCKNGKGCGWWWLRTLAADGMADIINIEGKGEVEVVYHINGIVPAMFIQTMAEMKFFD